MQNAYHAISCILQADIFLGAVPVKFVLMIQYDPTTVDEFVTEFTPVFLLMCFLGLVQNSSTPKNLRT